MKEYLARSRTILLHPDLAEGVARAEFAAEYSGVFMWRDGLAVGAWPRRTHLRQLVRNSRLVNELLFGVRAERNLAIIEALLLNAMVHSVVVGCGFGSVWRCIQPPSCVSYLLIFHMLCFWLLMIYIWRLEHKR